MFHELNFHCLYSQRPGKVCFICEHSEDSRLQGNDIEAWDYNNRNTCSLCSVVLDCNKPQNILTHVAAHILFDPRVDRSSEPCGLCLSPSPICRYILKGGKIDMNASSGCKNLRKEKAFNYKSASSSTKSSPSTNVPLSCPLCPRNNPAIWKYNMLYHFRSKHSRVSFDTYKALWEVQPAEQQLMEQAWDIHDVIPKTRSLKKKKTRIPLVISDAHSSKMAFRYVDLGMQRS